MITFTSGNILKAEVQALVNPVNCVGVMGAGLAKQFRDTYKRNYDAYVRACKGGNIIVGGVWVFDYGEEEIPDRVRRYIVNFPTKDDWRAPSLIGYIEDGLQDLKWALKEYTIQSIAIPPLGCGLGGLRWEAVRPLIVNALEDLDVTTLIYGAEE